jgi:hypothetical protein
MRNLAPSTTRCLAAVVTLTALAACSAERVAQPPPPPVDWQSFVRASADAGPSVPTAKESTVAEQYAQALSTPEGTKLGALFDDDAHFAFPGREDAQGRDAVVREHGVLFGSFEPRRFATSRIWRTASQQMAEWTMSGVQAREWLGLPATQKPVSIRGITLLWTKDDGRISDCHVYFDVAAVRVLLGSPPDGRSASAAATKRGELSGVTAPSTPSGPPQYIDRKEADLDNVATMRGALDALESNEGAYVDALTDDVEVHTLERAEPARGKEEARAYFKAMHKAIAQLDTTMRNGWNVAQFGIVEYTIEGEQRGSLGWIPPQHDAVIRLHVVDVDEIRDGKIARVWRFDNPSEVLESGP